MTEIEFNKYIEKTRPKMLNFAASIIDRGAATADDMVQEAVLKVWNRLSQGEIEIKNIDALITTILKNVCLDYLRLPKNRQDSKVEIESYSKETIGFTSTSSDPQRSIELKEQVIRVMEAMKNLPAEQQMAVRLRDVMGYEIDKIAEILDTTEGNVRTMLSRSRKQLRLWI